MKRLLLAVCLMGFSSAYAQNKWDGGHTVGNFTAPENWDPNGVPTTWNNGVDLEFVLNNNGQTSIYYDFGDWVTIRSMFFGTDYNTAIIFDAIATRGIDFWEKIENKSSTLKTLRIELSYKGGGAMQLNPVNGDLTFDKPIYNDLNRNIDVWGDNGKKITLNGQLLGNGSARLYINEYSIVSINHACNASEFAGGATVNEGELWFEAGSNINGGNITVGSADNYAKLYLHDVDGGYSLTNTINVPGAANHTYIGGLNNSGINTFAGNITLSGPATLEAADGGTVNFSGDIGSSGDITIDRVGGTGTGIVQFSGMDKTNSGSISIAGGATLRISSNQAVQQLTILTGGKLIVDAGATLTLNNSFLNSGIIENNGTIIVVGASSFPGNASAVTAMNNLVIDRTGNANLAYNLNISGSLTLTKGTYTIMDGYTLTLDGASMSATAGSLTGGSTSSLAVQGTAVDTVTIPGAITLQNLTVSGNRVVQLNGTHNLNLYGALTINPGATFSNGGDTSQVTSNPGAAIAVSGTFVTMHPGGFSGTGSAVPSVPITLNAGSTVEYARAGDQVVQALNDYKNLTLSASGTKTLVNATCTPAGTVFIKDDAVFDVSNNTFGGAGTSLTMTGGRLRISGAGTKPAIDGSYDLQGGVIEFYNSGTAANEAIKGTNGVSAPIQYLAIEVTGNKVGKSTANITMKTGGTFTIKNGAIFEINSGAVQGPTGLQTLMVETGGTFRTGDALGFSGGTNTSVKNDIEAVILQPGSNVEYSRAGVQLITNAQVYQNLTLSGSGIKTAPADTLTVQGDLTKVGTASFDHANGAVLLNGTDQSFAGLDYNILELTSGTKTLAGGASIRDSLKINASTTLSIPASDSIVLHSTIAKTARVGLVPSDAVINYNGTGKFVVERYLDAYRAWRLLSMPTTFATQTLRNSWLENGAAISNYGFKAYDPRGDWAARGFDANGNNSSIKKWNPATESWLFLDNINAANASIETGYIAFVAGDRNIIYPNAGTTTLRTRGAIYTGTQPSIPLVTGKYNMVGNPYPSRIDLRNVNLANAGAGIFVFDPSLASGFGGSGSLGLGAFNVLELAVDGNYHNLFPSAIYGDFDSVNNFIESGQAMLVFGNAANASVTFEENDKVIGSANASFAPGAAQSLRVHLNLNQGGNATLLDGAVARFDSSWSNLADGMDVRKLGTFGESVAFNTLDSMLIIDRRFAVADNDTLHLNMRNMKAQSYQWQLISNNLDFPGRTGFLIDRYTNTTTPLNLAGSTTYNFAVQNVAGSYAADRFIIVFKQQALAPLPVTITTVSATRKEDKTIAVQWKVENEVNITGYEVERSADGQNFGSIASRAYSATNAGRYDHIDPMPLPADNFYRIKATSLGGQVQYSAIVKVGAVKQPAFMSVYPNPVVDGQMQVRFSGQAAGKYLLQLTNDAGQTLHSQQVMVNSGIQTQSITLPTRVANGHYRLRIQAPDGSVTTQQVTVQ